MYIEMYQRLWTKVSDRYEWVLMNKISISELLNTFHMFKVFAILPSHTNTCGIDEEIISKFKNIYKFNIHHLQFCREKL